MPDDPLPSLPNMLIHMLDPYPEGVRLRICWQALRNTVLPHLSYPTVNTVAWRLRQQRCLVRMAWGRYALSPEFRAMRAALERRAAVAP